MSIIAKLPLEHPVADRFFWLAVFGFLIGYTVVQVVRLFLLIVRGIRSGRRESGNNT